VTEANKDDPPKPLPNGIVPHPQDFVVRIENMSPSGLAAGYLRIRAADGNIEVFGFDVTDDGAWTQIEKINPAIVKLCRNHFLADRKMTHVRREILNAHECISRANDVALGKRQVMT
jgi:hypothetical protein